MSYAATSAKVMATQISASTANSPALCQQGQGTSISMKCLPSS